MGRLVTIDIDDLRKVMHEVAIDTVYQVVGTLREDEIVISNIDAEKHRKAVEFMENVNNDIYLKGCEVKDILGCSSSQVTKLKNAGVLEPIYLSGNKAPRYSKLKLLKMIKDRTIPKYK